MLRSKAGYGHAAGAAAYAASKAGVMALFDSLAEEVKPTHQREFNCAKHYGYSGESASNAEGGLQRVAEDG